MSEKGSLRESIFAFYGAYPILVRLYHLLGLLFFLQQELGKGFVILFIIVENIFKFIQLLNVLVLQSFLPVIKQVFYPISPVNGLVLHCVDAPLQLVLTLCLLLDTL